MRTGGPGQYRRRAHAHIRSERAGIDRSLRGRPQSFGSGTRKRSKQHRSFTRARTLSTVGRLLGRLLEATAGSEGILQTSARGFLETAEADRTSTLVQTHRLSLVELSRA